MSLCCITVSCWWSESFCEPVNHHVVETVLVPVTFVETVMRLCVECLYLVLAICVLVFCFCSLSLFFTKHFVRANSSFCSLLFPRCCDSTGAATLWSLPHHDRITTLKPITSSTHIIYEGDDTQPVCTCTRILYILFVVVHNIPKWSKRELFPILTSF